MGRTRVRGARSGQAGGADTPRQFTSQKRADWIMASMDRQQEFVLRTLEERDIRFVRLWFTDVSGYLKAVAVAPAEIEAAFAEGIGFDGSAIEGFARVYESDMLAKPDPGTFQVMPAPQRAARATPRGCSATSRCPTARRRGPTRGTCCAARWARPPTWGSPSTPTPRSSSSCSRTCRPTAARREPADTGGYFDLSTHNVAHDFRREAVFALEAMGISVEFSHHEVAPGQQEIDLRYADALSMADNIMTLRHVVREVALAQGVHATFMPKPFTELAGSAMHTHLSLFEGDRNAFHDPADPMRLSTTGKQFIAGLLTHAREVTAVTNQTVNSYRRLLAGTEAPTAATWGRANRSALVRLPQLQAEQGRSRRASRSARRTRRPTPTSPSPSCWPPACAGSRRATSCRPRPRTTSGRSPTPSAARPATRTCRCPSARR